MKKSIHLFTAICMVLVGLTSCSKMELFDSGTVDVSSTVDVSGISLKSVDVLVEYTAAKVFGEIRVTHHPERITEVRVQYGTSADNLSKTVKAAYDTENGFSADLTSLEDGVQFFYRVEILVGKTTAYKDETVKDFVTFPKGPIDLDLPSGKKWASQNIGAVIPTEAGDYYAWGEVEPKSRYEWSTYKYCKGTGSYRDFTKYSTKSIYADGETADNRDELLAEDDVARKTLGAHYSIPTYADWHELIQYCDITVVTINGTRGCKISSQKDKNNNKKFIFFASDTGFYNGTAIVKGDAYYWSSTLDTGLNSWAKNVRVGVLGLLDTTGARYYGESIRPVYE